MEGHKHHDVTDRYNDSFAKDQKKGSSHLYLIRNIIMSYLTVARHRRLTLFLIASRAYARLEISLFIGLDFSC